MSKLRSETVQSGNCWLIVAVLFVAGFILVAPASIRDAAARDCQSTESEEECTKRETAICVENANNYHIDWVMDCIGNAKGGPALSQDVCGTYHSLQPLYAAKCKGSPTDGAVKATCTYLKTHKQECG